MRIATWNINSIRARAERALDVLNRWDLDVLLLQETKCKPAQFPTEGFEAAGYEVAAHGLDQWNGVAIISRVGIDDVAIGFPGQPAFAKEDDNGELVGTPKVEARAISATCAGLRVWSLYIPNGRAVDDAHYRYKLDFLGRLREYCAGELARDAAAPLLLGGDWNVIPTDDDVWDPDLFRDELYATPAERAAFNAMAEAGLVEVSRAATNVPYTFWDYQQLRFPKNEGMRIDFVWASRAVAKRVTSAHIDRDERKGKGSSDHVPVILDIDAPPEWSAS